MQFVSPQRYTEAVEKIGSKSPIGSALSSSQWRDVPVALRERAFFSSRIESVRWLAGARGWLEDFLSATRETLAGGDQVLAVGSRAQFIDRARGFALESGLGPLDPKDKGTVKDITSERRLGLIFDTQTRQAQDFGYWRQGQDPDVLDAFPAQRFIRVDEVASPRDWHRQFEGEVRLKSDLAFWTAINQDFGVPWGPWGWGCGHDVEDVDREEAEQIGLLQAGEAVAPVLQSFNDGLQASTQGLGADLVEMLRSAFGDRVQISGDGIRWAGGAEPQGS